MLYIAGLDLAAKNKNPSGLAIAKGNHVEVVCKVYSDEEIIERLLRYNVSVVAVDAPLAHAKGYRRVDLEMKKRGFKVLPPGWNAMKTLVDRAIRLKSFLERHNIVVIETHPKSALKASGYEDYITLFKDYLIMDYATLSNLSKDEVDALICLLVAYYYTKGKVCVVEADDGIIYLLPTLK